MSMKEFGRVVRTVMASLPEDFHEFLDNVVVDIQMEPDLQTLRQMGFTEEEIEAGDSLYGLFVPLDGIASGADEIDNPHRILIYKRPLEEDFPDEKELMIEIRKTVIHELAHHFGWTDRDLQRFDDNPDPFRDGQ